MQFKISLIDFGDYQKNNHFSIQTIFKNRFFIVIYPYLNIGKSIYPNLINHKQHILSNFDLTNRACEELKAFDKQNNFAKLILKIPIKFSLHLFVIKSASRVLEAYKSRHSLGSIFIKLDIVTNK